MAVDIVSSFACDDYGILFLLFTIAAVWSLGNICLKRNGEPVPVMSDEYLQSKTVNGGGVRAGVDDRMSSNLNVSPRQKSSHVIAVDIGTTSIRCHLYDKTGRTKGFSSCNTVLLEPKPGWKEIDPLQLWNQFVTVIRHVIAESAIPASEIACIGITNLRGTFTTWSRKTGKPHHNLITWQDTRSAEICKQWNVSYTFKSIRGISRMAHMVMGTSRQKAAGMFEFNTMMSITKLKWLMENIPEVSRSISQDDCCFGTVDSWLLWKLSNGGIHVTDYSNASSTGMFDPFLLSWSGILLKALDIPHSILPALCDTSSVLCKTDADMFGAEIPVTAVVGDQQSALFAQCCFGIGDVKCTMGTGTFMCVNTGSQPYAIVSGFYPAVAWKIGSETVFMVEGSVLDTGNCLDWAKSLELFTEYDKLTDIALSVPDSGGVAFVSAFSGLRIPFRDPHACSLFLGLKASTTKAHLLRAVLESIAFSVKHLFETQLSECHFDSRVIRIDGGVAQCDFIMQLIADLTYRVVDRCDNADMTSMGAAMLAGLAVGVWEDQDELKKLRKGGKKFYPADKWSQYKEPVENWEKALNRAMSWYKH